MFLSLKTLYRKRTVIWPFTLHNYTDFIKKILLNFNLTLYLNRGVENEAKQKEKPLMITILIILLVLLSYIINVTTINYCMLLVFLIIVLCWVEWKRIKIEIDSF